MSKIEIYQSKLGEEAVKLFIERCWNLELKKIPERKGKKTPDYEIKDNEGNIIAICEVKSCTDSSVVDSGNSKIFELSQKAERSHTSKLEKHNSKAMSQLVNYSNFPIIIIFVSFDMTDSIDMSNMLQQHKSLYPNSKIADVYLLFKVHQNLIPSSTFEINQTPMFKYDNSHGKDFLDKYFSLEKALENKAILPLIFNI